MSYKVKHPLRRVPDMLSLVFFRMVNWNDLDTESSECSCPRTAEEVPMGEDNNGDSMLQYGVCQCPSCPRVSRVMVHSCHSFTSCGAMAPKISNMGQKTRPKLVRQSFDHLTIIQYNSIIFLSRIAAAEHTAHSIPQAQVNARNPPL